MFKNLVFLFVFFLIGVKINGDEFSEFMSDENFVPCPNPEDFHCANGGVCIKSELECDGNKDCPDGSDESESECDFKLCKPPKFYTCKDKSKTCIVENYRCDGHNDCPLNDDEEYCENYIPHHEKIECNDDEFTCLKDNMCIPMDFVCDGIKQCMDGSDEALGCFDIEKKCKGFLCKNRHCLTDKSWVCDGRNDCGDYSDEKNCMTDCTLDKRKFQCNDNVTCIPIQKVCNKDKDCMDGSDEGGICDKFSNNTACELHYCPTEAECFIAPTGPLCVCPTGFFYNSKKKICEDIDECQTYGICSQGCINTPGSYYCTCVKRFRLKGDNKTCESLSHTEPLLIYAGKTSINMVYLRTGHQTIVTDKVRQVIGVSYDGHFVYWTNVAQNTESIVKAREDGTKMETLLANGLMLPEDIAVDWITGNLYFSDAMLMHIAVCSNDGKHCTKLVTENVENPRSIALYPQEGRMYWSEWGAKPMIAVAHMDGSFAAPFISENIHWPSGTALDWPNNRLYWVDAKLKKIESCNLDGSNRRTVIENVLKHPYGLAIFENNIYWSDWNAMSVETCDKFTCKDRKIIVKDRKVYDIHIYHNSIQPITNNPCKNNKCSHLCMLRSNLNHTCGCPQGMALNIDQITCSAVWKKESVYIGMRNYLITMEHEIFGRHQIEKAKVLPVYINKMAFNLLNGNVFIADNIAKTISEYQFDNGGILDLVEENIGEVSSLAFDHLSNNLYWSDSDFGTIEVFSMDKKQRTIVYHYAGTAKPISIAVIPELGQMFVALKSVLGHTHIDIQSLHGSGPHHHLIETYLGDGSIQFAVDRSVQEIFWTDSALRKISWTDFTGQSHHIFKLLSGEPTSLAILRDDVFWTKNNSLDVYWTPKHSPETTRLLKLPPHEYVSKFDDVVVVAVTPTIVVNHPCSVNSGGCSHICATYSATEKICLCPPGMVFTNNLNNTCMEAIDCEFRCDSGECITASRQCNNIKDCADNSDESNCAATTTEKIDKQCLRGQFKCADGQECILIENRCDKTVDCHDRSDEVDCANYDPETKCHAHQFACPNRLCIDLTAVCDGFNDCEDGADELKCHDKKAMKHVCTSNYFTCASGQCVPSQWICDETPDCTDGSDEHNCPDKGCPEGYMRCKHGQCIHPKLVCDGFNNCGDNADELNCTNAAPEMKCQEFDSDNEPLKFQCTSDKTICLDITARCNGTAECPGGEDEAACSGCRIDEFECANKKCIRKEWLCDQQNDCGDRSDETDCNDVANTTRIMSHHCEANMFDCKDGNCIDWDQVCDGHNDCSQATDESSKCATSCDKNPCEQICRKSPLGGVCSCKEGFSLHVDQKSCLDINECKVSEPCAQKCENLHGSFRCSCFVDYMLKSDKVSCKSIGSAKHILYSSLNVIYDISPSTLGILWSANSSKIAGMDVNVRENLLYFTVEDSRALYEMNLETKKIVYVTNIGNPHHIAVDWLTNNVYFFDQNTSMPSIKICHMSQKVCARIIPLRYRDVVKSLIVDSTNNRIFIAIMHIQYSMSQSFIYSHNLDGTRAMMLVKGESQISGLSCDPNKKILYFSDLSTRSVWSVNYNGEDRKELFKDSTYVTKPSDLSFHEDLLLILNVGSKVVAACKTYGSHKCTFYEFNSYNAENIVVVQESRQKEKANNCKGSNCSLICVPAELGPKCLCHGEMFVDNGVACKNQSNNVMMPYFSTDAENNETKSNHNVLVTIFAVFGVLVGSTFFIISALYLYRYRSNLRKTFDVSMHFENPSLSNIDNAQVKMCRQAELTSAKQYNEIFVHTQVPTTSKVTEEYDNNFIAYGESDKVGLIY